MQHEHVYTRYEVVALGFEARCIDPRGTCYLWHDDCGLCVDELGQAITMIIDPGLLPEGPWLATAWGEKELLEGELWR